MANEIQKASAIDRVLIQGDLSALNEEQRLSYYFAVCKSCGLNPLTKPFDLIKLNGKLVLYPNRSGADQMRYVHAVSFEVTERKFANDLAMVTVRASMGSRTDEAMGAVSVKGLVGENLANAIMKAETKAKRRATLSICGLVAIDDLSRIEAAREQLPRWGAMSPSEMETKIRPAEDLAGEEAAQAVDRLIEQEKKGANRI